MGELKPLYPLIGKTLAEGGEWLESQSIESPQNNSVTLKHVRSINGPITLDLRSDRVNVRMDDNERICEVVDIG